MMRMSAQWGVTHAFQALRRVSKKIWKKSSVAVLAQIASQSNQSDYQEKRQRDFSNRKCKRTAAQAHSLFNQNHLRALWYDTLQCLDD